MRRGHRRRRAALPIRGFRDPEIGRRERRAHADGYAIDFALDLVVDGAEGVDVEGG